jgi:hypothetical protein
MRGNEARVVALACLLLCASGCDGADGTDGDAGVASDGRVPGSDGGRRLDGAASDGAPPDGAAADAGCRDGWRDADGDGVGDPADAVRACDGPLPEGYVDPANGADCDDARADRSEGAEAFPDADGDGWGTAPAVTVCVTDEGSLPPRFAREAGDCADDDAGRHPGLLDAPNDEVDTDCDDADATFDGVVFVGEPQPSGGPGSGTAADPFQSLQAGLDEAVARGGGTVVVEEARYRETLTFDADLPVLVVGGYRREGAAWIPERRFEGTDLEAPTGAAAPALTVTAGELQLAHLDIEGPVVEGAGTQRGQALDVQDAAVVLRDVRVRGASVLSTDDRSVGWGIRLRGGSLRAFGSTIVGGYDVGARIVDEPQGPASSTALEARNGATVRLAGCSLGAGVVRALGGVVASVIDQRGGSLHVYDSRFDEDSTGAYRGNGEPALGFGIRAAEARVVLAGNDPIEAPAVSDGNPEARVVGVELEDSPAILVDNTVNGGSVAGENRARATGLRASGAPVWLRRNRIHGGTAGVAFAATASDGAETFGIDLVDVPRFVFEANVVGAGRPVASDMPARALVQGTALRVAGVSRGTSANNVYAALDTALDLGNAAVRTVGLELAGGTLSSLHDVYDGGDATRRFATSSEAVTVLATGGEAALVNVALVEGTADDATVGLRRTGGTVHLAHVAFVNAGESAFDALVEVVPASGEPRRYGDPSDLDGCAAWTEAEGCGALTAGVLAADDPYFRADEDLERRFYGLRDPGPLVDAGRDPTDLPASLPGELGLTAVDYEGEPRPRGAGWDIGVDETDH